MAGLVTFLEIGQALSDDDAIAVAAITRDGSAEHMDDNIGAVGWSIKDDERERLDEVSYGARTVSD